MVARKIVRFAGAKGPTWGILESDPPHRASDRVIVRELRTQALTTGELIAELGVGAADEGEAVTLGADHLLSPISANAQLLCQGLNYGAHASEAQHHERKSNLLFAKASSSLTGPYAPILRPAEVELLDYEVEFAIVLRRGIRAEDRITQANLGDYVAGVVLCNDVSARDTMFGATFLQWFRGKSYRTFCPAGPVLWYLEPDEVAEALANIEISLWVNDELRQSATSQQLIYKPLETLQEIGASIDMNAGDLLLTGTPGGVTSPASPAAVEILRAHLMADDARRDALRIEMTKTRPFLAPGDIVRATMTDLRNGEQFGGLANLVADA